VTRYVVAPAAALPEGGRLIVSVAGREIGIFNVAGSFYAVRNRCAHQGGPLCEGELLGALNGTQPGEHRYDPAVSLLECPWHGWEYDLRTGQSWFDPGSVKVRPYPVEVKSGAALEIDPKTGLAKGPFVVETYPVSVDSDYLVVDVSG
jgi:nitrite reductase/ring-hydroxylating ferredoxin subunit